MMGETNVHNPIKCPLDIAPYPLSSQPNSVETSPSMSSSNWRSTTPIRTELGHRCCVSGGGSSYDGAGRHGDTVRQNTEILQVGTCFGVFLVKFGLSLGSGMGFSTPEPTSIPGGRHIGRFGSHWQTCHVCVFGVLNSGWADQGHQALGSSGKRMRQTRCAVPIMMRWGVMLLTKYSRGARWLCPDRA